MIALYSVSSVSLVLDVDAVFNGSIICCASKQSFPHPSKDKQLCRFSTKPAAEQRDRRRCTFHELEACTSCGLAFFDGRRQGLAGLLATKVFDLTAPVTVLRRLSKNEERVEVSVWDPELVRSAQSAGGQVSARLRGLTVRGLEAEMQCLHSPGCSPRFEVAASEWSKVMALDFVVQNDDRLDTSRCGVSHPLFHGYENLTSFGSTLRGAAWYRKKFQPCSSTQSAEASVLHIFDNDSNSGLAVLDTTLVGGIRSFDQLNWNALWSLREAPDSALARALALPQDVPAWARIAGLADDYLRDLSVIKERAEMAIYYSDFVRWLRTPRTPETPALAFSAIPNVGGTAIENILVSNVKKGVFSFADHGHRHKSKWQSCNGTDCRLLLGYGTLADMRAKVGTTTDSSLRTFMLFREPLSRSMSSYHYNFLGTKGRRRAKPDTYITVLQYAAQTRWCNVQTRYLSGDLSPIYTEEDGQERLLRAVRNLRNVTAIGVTSHLEESLGMLEAVWQTVASSAGLVTKENTSLRSTLGLTEEERVALRKCDALDNKLFVNVRRRFVAQRAACRATGKCGLNLLTPWEPWEKREPFQRMSHRSADQQPTPSLAALPLGRNCYHSCQDTCWSYRPPSCSVKCGAACKRSCCNWWRHQNQTGQSY